MFLALLPDAVCCKQMRNLVRIKPARLRLLRWRDVIPTLLIMSNDSDSETRARAAEALETVWRNATLDAGELGEGRSLLEQDTACDITETICTISEASICTPPHLPVSEQPPALTDGARQEPNNLSAATPGYRHSSQSAASLSAATPRQRRSLTPQTVTTPALDWLSSSLITSPAMITATPTLTSLNGKGSTLDFPCAAGPASDLVRQASIDVDAGSERPEKPMAEREPRPTLTANSHAAAHSAPRRCGATWEPHRISTDRPGMGMHKLAPLVSPEGRRGHELGRVGGDLCLHDDLFPSAQDGSMVRGTELELGCRLSCDSAGGKQRRIDTPPARDAVHVAGNVTAMWSAKLDTARNGVDTRRRLLLRDGGHGETSRQGHSGQNSVSGGFGTSVVTAARSSGTALFAEPEWPPCLAGEDPSTTALSESRVFSYLFDASAGLEAAVTASGHIVPVACADADRLTLANGQGPERSDASRRDGALVYCDQDERRWTSERSVAEATMPSKSGDLAVLRKADDEVDDACGDTWPCVILQSQAAPVAVDGDALLAGGRAREHHGAARRGGSSGKRASWDGACWDAESLHGAGSSSPSTPKPATSGTDTDARMEASDTDGGTAALGGPSAVLEGAPSGQPGACRKRDGFAEWLECDGHKALRCELGDLAGIGSSVRSLDRDGHEADACKGRVPRAAQGASVSEGSRQFEEELRPLLEALAGADDASYAGFTAAALRRR